MASMAAIRAADNAAMKANTPTYNTQTGHIDKPASVTTSAKAVANSSMPTTVDYVTTPSNAVAQSVDFDSILNQVRDVVAQNNAISKEMAQMQYDFNREEAQKSREFNSAEAQKNRDWQEYMSNTAHQREMADLLAAGLNPILTANSGAAMGSGATASSSPASGSMASPDTSMNSVLGAFLSSLISSATAINTANINARTNLAIGQLNHDAAVTSAGINSSAMRYSAEQSRSAQQYNADTSYMANILKNMTSIDVAKISQETGLGSSAIRGILPFVMQSILGL